MNTSLFIYGIFHIFCGIVSFGLTFGFFQNKWPKLAFEDRGCDSFFALVYAGLGPIGLLFSLFLSNFGQYGLKFKITK